MTGRETVEQRYRQIPEDIQNHVRCRIRQMAIGLYRFEAAEHQTAHALEHAGKAQARQHTIDGVQPFTTILEEQDGTARIGLKRRANGTHKQ